MACELWIGPKQGQTSYIIRDLSQDKADAKAREIVNAAIQEGKEMVAQIFSNYLGRVIGGYATPGLKDQLTDCTQIKILEAGSSSNS